MTTHKSQWMNEYCKNPLDYAPPPATRDILTTETAGLEPFLDHYVDSFVTVGGRSRTGILITDNYFWKFNKGLNLKTAKCENGSWYLIYNLK